MIVDVGHRACLRFVSGYYWLLYVDYCRQLLTADGYFLPLAAIEGRVTINQISLHGSEVQERGEIERRLSSAKERAIAQRPRSIKLVRRAADETVSRIFQRRVSLLRSPKEKFA